MKRSEMIKLLEQHLIEDHGLDFLSDKPIVVAADILHFLESRGMRPPKEKVTWNLKSHTRTFITETWESEE
jgi:hypothetical protein